MSELEGRQRVGCILTNHSRYDTSVYLNEQEPEKWPLTAAEVGIKFPVESVRQFAGFYGSHEFPKAAGEDDGWEETVAVLQEAKKQPQFEFTSYYNNGLPRLPENTKGLSTV